MSRCGAMIAVALCILAVACTAEAYNRGEGTAYSGPYDKDATGFNSCQFGKLDDRWERYYAALPSHVFERERDCGKCIRARGTEEGASGEWVKVMVVDECASCKGDGDVDFSTTALEAITGFDWDRKGIEWEWTSCDDDEDVSEETAEQASDDNNDDDDDNNNEDDEDDNNEDDEDDNNNDDNDNNDDDDEEEEDKRRKNRRLLRA